MKAKAIEALMNQASARNQPAAEKVVEKAANQPFGFWEWRTS